MSYNKCKIPNTLSINSMITVSLQQFSGGYFFSGESHNFYEAVCILEGTVGVTAGKNIFLLSEGQMTIHRPLEFHSICEHGDSCAKVIIFSFDALAFPKIRSYIYNLSKALQNDIRSIYEMSKSVFSIPPLPPVVNNEDGSSAVFDHGLHVIGIRDGMQSSAFRFSKRLESFLSEALDSPSDIQVQYSDASSENYFKIFDVLEQNIDKNIKLDELARQCRMSVPLIEKIMHKYLGCGAMSYYNNMRMSKAYKLLSSGESVKHTAACLGFSNQNYFSLSFKKHFGHPPSALKRLS